MVKRKERVVRGLWVVVLMGMVLRIRKRSRRVEKVRVFRVLGVEVVVDLGRGAKVARRSVLWVFQWEIQCRVYSSLNRT